MTMTRYIKNQKFLGRDARTGKPLVVPASIARRIPVSNRNRFEFIANPFGSGVAYRPKDV